MNDSALAAFRAGLGLVQGIAIYALFRAVEAKSWPATDGLIFAPSLAVLVLLPPLIASSISHLRPRTFAIWIVTATVLCAGLSWYDVFRDPDAISYQAFGGPQVAGSTQRIAPTNALWLWLSTGLFIAHSLILSGEADRRFIARYSTYFDISWKLGLQFALAWTFVGAFWLFYWLGAELFRLVRIEFLHELMGKRWFSFPATSLAFMCALHVTDVRAGIINGTRGLILTLLSWLLPLMAALTIAFVIALPFTSLDPLWNTKRATGILVACAAALVFLINAAYQDGPHSNRVSLVLRYAMAAASAVLVPLVALAAYALLLRVQQYGWTTQRVIAQACIVIAACYAIGYAAALFSRDLSLRRLETINILAAFVVLAVLLALFTPLADPARLAVLDQVSRLERGEIAPDKFDFAFLRFQSGRYGHDALERLKRKSDGPEAASISLKANEALDWRTIAEARRQGQAARPFPSPLTRSLNITIIGATGRSLPEKFLQHDWSKYNRAWQLPICLLPAAGKCEAILTDLDGDARPEILLFSAPTGVSAAFKADESGNWSFLGTIANAHCAGVRDALRQGKFEMTDAKLKDVSVNGVRLRIGDACLP